MARTDYKVSELVNKIEQGELQLPEMQRRYVWTATKVRDLLDSLYRGYPSGVILAWQSAGQVETREFSIAAKSSPGTPPLLLLDGQQRFGLTTTHPATRVHYCKPNWCRSPAELINPGSLSNSSQIGASC